MSNQNNVEFVMDIVKNIGVKVFKYGDTLANESIFNFLLSKVEIVDTDKNLVAAVTFKDKHYQLLCNFDNLAQLTSVFVEPELKEAYIRSVFKHELFHIALRHLFIDMKNYNHYLMNIVTDALLNQYIPETGYVNKTEDRDGVLYISPEVYLAVALDRKDLLAQYNNDFGTISGPALYLVDMIKEQQIHGFPVVFYSSKMCSTMSAEQYYDYLVKLFKLDQCVSVDSSIVQTVDGNDLEPTDEIVDLQDILEKEHEEIDMYIKDRGLSGHALDRLYVKVAYEHKKPLPEWKALLKRTLSKLWTGNQFKNEYSMMRQDRRTDLYPGKRKVLVNTRILALIDSSGSISQPEITAFVKELFNAKKQYQFDCTVVVYDTDITYKNKFEQFLKDLDRNEIYGGGGTNVNNVLKELINENPHQRYDCMVVLTDCYDNVPKQKYVQSLLNSKNNVLIISTSTESNVGSYVHECKDLGYKWTYLEIED